MNIRIAGVAITLGLAVAGQARAEFPANGIYGTVEYESYLALTPAQHELYKAQLHRLSDSNFVVLPDSGYATHSNYQAILGRSELEEISTEILELCQNYSRIVTIGRSLTGIEAYTQARLSAHPTHYAPPITNLPFSNSDPHAAVTPEQRAGLRSHLLANHLSPLEIASASKPTLFADFVYRGVGAGKLLEEINLWAQELNMETEVKKKLHFLGLFPAQTIAKEFLVQAFREENKLTKGSAPAITEEMVLETAATAALPNEKLFEQYASKVLHIRISDNFYLYSGTLAPLAQKSFVREVWDKPVDRTVKFSFAGHETEPAYIELYYLMWAGVTDGLEEVRGAGCEAGLLMGAAK